MIGVYRANEGQSLREFSFIQMLDQRNDIGIKRGVIPITPINQLIDGRVSAPALNDDAVGRNHRTGSI